MRARGMIAHAEKHMGMDTDIDRMIAVWNLDTAVEYILRILLIHLEYEETDIGKPLNTLIDISTLLAEADKFVSSKYGMHLKYQNEVKMLRNLRNAIQHGMADPTRDITRIRNFVIRFFKAIVNTYFGKSIDEFSLSSLIQIKQISKILKNCEKLILEKEYKEAIKEAKNAFDYFYILLLYADPESLFLDEILIYNNFKFDSINRYLEFNRKELIFIKHNIDWHQYNKFQILINSLPKNNIHEQSRGWVHERQWTQNDATFSYSFVSDLIYRNSNRINDFFEITNNETYQRNEFLNSINLNFIQGQTIFSNLDYLHILTGYTKNRSILKIKRLKEPITWKILQHEKFKKKISLIQFNCKITFFNLKMMCNKPAIWRIILVLEQLPFSYLNYMKFNDVISKHNLVLNNVNEHELFTKLYWSLTKTDCKKIVTHRNKYGCFTSSEDLRKIKILNSDKIKILEKYTILNEPDSIPEF